MENNTNGSNPKPSTNDAVKKAPLVKRIKVPTVRHVAPAAQAAPQVSAASDTTTPARQFPSVQNNPEPQQKETQNVEASSTASANDAEKAEKNLPQKKKHSPLQASNDIDLPSKTELQMKKAKITLKVILANKWVGFGISLCLIGIICGGIYSALPLIAEKHLPSLFAANGMPFQKFKIKELTTKTMELTNVSDKTGTLSISSIKFDYSLFSLYLSNSINSMTLSGVTVNGERRNDGISLGALSNMIYSPINVAKGKELTIHSLQIQNGTFVLKDMTPPKKIINEEGEEVEEDGTVSVQFSAKGSLSHTGLNMEISTNYSSPQLSLKTETTLNKTVNSSQIKMDISEGNILKQNEKTGAITGSTEIAIYNGVLSTGTADLLISSSTQKLKLTAGIAPKESSFDLSLDLDRSFDDLKDAAGKFVGTLSVKANDVTVSGTFENFTGKLPLQIKAPTLTNGQTTIQNLDTDMDLKFSCANMNCSVSLTKPMNFSFSSLQTVGLQRQIKFFTPLSLTINPDPNEPFLKSEGHILTFTLPVSAFKTQLFLTDNFSNLQVATVINGLKSSVKYNLFNGAYAGEAVFQQSGYADKDIRMTGIQGIVSFNSNSLPNARLRVANVALTKPDILPEFSADIRLRPGNRMEFGVDSSIYIQNGVITATVNGSYSLPDHEWDLYLVVPKFILSEEGLKLSSVLPFMQKYLPDTTTGSVAAKGRIATQQGAIVGPLNVFMENVNTKWNDFSIEALNGVVTLSSLSPLATPESQQLFIGTLNTGIPFENALFNFRINANKGIEFANMRMQYAEGQFKTIKSFHIPYEGQPSAILFEGNGINLSMLTENLKSSALQADGIVNSEWKLSFTENKKININQAVFTTKLPGTLHFTPPESLRGKMNPKMAAYLKDVIVKNMKVTAKGQMDGLLSFDVSIKGHSPLETAENDQDVSFDFKSSFKNLLKQKGKPFEIPSDVLLALQNYSK